MGPLLFLAKVYLKRDNPADVIDMITDHVEDMLTEGKFKEVELLLELIDPGIYPMVINVAFLSATLAAKDRLPYRSMFYQYVRSTHTNLLDRLE